MDNYDAYKKQIGANFGGDGNKEKVFEGFIETIYGVRLEIKTISRYIREKSSEELNKEYKK
ncbi:MAG: hypothetical protein LBE57_02910 [Methanosarcinales archaeon]|jgi:hypothetical protein|nr:hypothetical protein [Methanosarcinales archaeon]